MIQLVSLHPPLVELQSSFAVVSNLTTQRNAIQMLHERITVLLHYVIGVVNSMSHLAGEKKLTRRTSKTRSFDPAPNLVNRSWTTDHGRPSVPA